jgi:ABC-type Na+ efflux pump permease subunit
MPSNVAVHTISFRGKAGAIFVLLCCAVVLFLVGFVTEGWAFSSNPQHREGLWESCECSRNSRSDDWFHAVQAMISIGLIMLLIAFLLIAIYMCVHTVSKNSTIIALVCFCFLAVLFMLIGFIIYAIHMTENKYTLSWSYAVTVLSSVLCLIAGTMSIVQMRSAGVHM